MMNRKENLLWVLYGGVLIFLFLLSSTDLIIKEKKAEVYPISVIVEDTSDDHYVNFRKGMERAAMELNADVSFITLYEQGNRQQQMDLLMREQEDGNRAVIAAPVDEEAVSELQAVRRASVPMVLLNTESELIKNENAAGITCDYHSMGCRLGERLLKEAAGYPVYLFGSRGHSLVNERLEAGLRSVLEPEGVEVRSYFLQKADGLGDVLGRLSGVSGDGAVVVALDPESLLAAAQLLEDGESGLSWIRGLYGRGNTVPILNYLDKGVIRGLCITDDFSAGYVSVEMAVELLRGHTRKEQKYLESGCIGREELRSGIYEKMLYPIE